MVRRRENRMGREPTPRPDWELIAAQMELWGYKDGLPPERIRREVREALRAMKAEYRRTGRLPRGWEDCVK